jgi:ankyrin repeat protein
VEGNSDENVYDETTGDSTDYSGNESDSSVRSSLSRRADGRKGDNLASAPSAGAIRHNKKKGISNIIRYDRTEDIIRVLATWTASDNQNHEQMEPETLLDTSSELNRPNKNRRTALHWAAARPGAGEIIRLLISLGADKRRKDKLGMTPLMQAVESKAMEDTIRLLASGTDLEAKNNKENTAL